MSTLAGTYDPNKIKKKNIFKRIKLWFKNVSCIRRNDEYQLFEVDNSHKTVVSEYYDWR